jgi:Mlc titration factor MtfA (ptsG expression regulator)
VLEIIAAAALFGGALLLAPAIRRLIGRAAPGLPESAVSIPDEWREIVRLRVPLAARLGDGGRALMLARMADLIHRVNFEGVAGVDVSDDIRVIVAAQACIVGLGLPPDCLDDVTTVLIYPSTFVPREFTWVRGGVPHRPPEPTLGESWTHGTVILAWDGVVSGASHPSDGVNLVIHEFAHQLDRLSDRPGGIIETSHAALERDLARGLPSFLDPYAATNPAEFFAVASESFFERPTELRQSDPALYRTLVEFYRQDPERWPDGPWRERPSAS